MEAVREAAVNEYAVKAAIIEIKLFVNRRLYQKGLLTEEMYNRAKDYIYKGDFFSEIRKIN